MENSSEKRIKLEAEYTFPEDQMTVNFSGHVEGVTPIELVMALCSLSYSVLSQLPGSIVDNVEVFTRSLLIYAKECEDNAHHADV